MLFPVLAAFLVDLDFFLFVKRKSCLKNNARLAKHTPVCGFQLHRPSFLLQKAKEGQSPTAWSILCLFHLCSSCRSTDLMASLLNLSQ